MEDLKLELEDLKRRWEDGHRQLVRLEAATREEASALQWLGARFAARTDKEMGPHDFARSTNRGDGGGDIFKGYSSRSGCITEGTNRKRGTSTSNDKSTYEAIGRVVAGDSNTHVS